MTELQADKSVAKLLEYAKEKKRITYDEVNDFLPDSIVNSEKIEEVIALLEEHNISLDDEQDKTDDMPMTTESLMMILSIWMTTMTMTVTEIWMKRVIRPLKISP